MAHSLCLSAVSAGAAQMGLVVACQLLEDDGVAPINFELIWRRLQTMEEAQSDFREKSLVFKVCRLPRTFLPTAGRPALQVFERLLELELVSYVHEGSHGRPPEVRAGRQGVPGRPADGVR